MTDGYIEFTLEHDVLLYLTVLDCTIHNRFFKYLCININVYWTQKLSIFSYSRKNR